MKQALVTDVWSEFYTADAIQFFTFNHANACNTSNGAVGFYLCTVAPGGTPQESNAIVWGLNVAADDHLVLLENMILLPNYTIQVKASITNRICLTLCGETS